METILTMYSNFVHEIMDALMPILSSWGYDTRVAWDKLESDIRTLYVAGQKQSNEKKAEFLHTRKEIRDIKRIISTLQVLLESM